MARFITGFFIASLIWAGLFYGQFWGLFDLAGAIGLNRPNSASPAALAPTVKGDGDESTHGQKNKTRRRAQRIKRRSSPDAFAGEPDSPRYDADTGWSGDDLFGSGQREVQAGQRGGEGQLSKAEIERGIDRAFQGIRRCLILIPSNAPLVGKLVIGMNIAGSGRVTKVNLKGPRMMIQGESGACLRKTVQSIQYPSFDGPDMVVHYPIEFE